MFRKLYRETWSVFLVPILFVLGCVNYESNDESYAHLVKRPNLSLSEQSTHGDSVVLHQALAEKYYSDRQYHLAVAEFSTVAELAPGDASAYEGLGRSYREMGEFDKAIKALEKGISITPQSYTSPIYAKLLCCKAVTCDMMGRHEEAIIEYEKATKFDPTNDTYYNNKGFSYLLQGQVEASISAFKKAIEINPNNKTAHSNLGYAYGLKGMYELALNEFKQAGDEAPAYNNMGYIYTTTGKLAEAIASYNNALKIDPSISSTYYNKGRTYELMGDIDNAIQAYQDFLKHTTKTSVAEEAFERIQALRRKKDKG